MTVINANIMQQVLICFFEGMMPCHECPSLHGCQETGFVVLKHMVSGSLSPKQMNHASIITHLFNQVSNLLHPFAIWFHYHELVLGSFAFLAHLSATVQAADASVNMLHVQL